MDQDLKFFDYDYIDNKAKRTLFLLHGTGGSREDFLFFDELLKKKYNLVGLQGNVDESGMARFFKRLEFGVFDQESIRKEASKLEQFVKAWIEKHKTSIEHLSFLGYSNGANMLLAALFYYPETFKKLVLLHPMLPFKIKKDSLDLSRHEIFVNLGINDQVISHTQGLEVVETLKSCEAKVTAKEYPGGHEMSGQEFEDIVDFLFVLAR